MSNLIALRPEPACAVEPIIGLYSVPASACSSVAAQGFNVVQSYDFESDRPPDAEAWLAIAKPYLDNAQKWGLRVLLGVPRNWLRGRLDAPTRAAVRALREHPALLAWYEDEIAQGGDVGAVAFYERIVSEEDPGHGVILEEGKDLPQLRPWGRVRMFTYYPVSAQARNAGRLKTLRERFPVGSLQKPFWPALQSYGRDLVQGYEKRDLVAPTKTELEYTLCSALAAGAGGIFFYTYMHSTRYDVERAKKKQWAYVDAKPIPEVSPSVWASVLNCAAAARATLPLVGGATSCKVVQVGVAADVEVGQWSSDGSVVVVLANPRYVNQVATLSLPPEYIRAQQWTDGAWKPLVIDTRSACAVLLQGPGGAILQFRKN